MYHFIITHGGKDGVEILLFFIVNILIFEPIGEWKKGAQKIRKKKIMVARDEAVQASAFNNAIKFSKPQGGTNYISIRKAGDMAHFSVSDTGIGFIKENLGKIFRLFYQEDSGISRKYDNYLL